MAHATPPSALEQGGPIRVEHDRQRRQFSVRLNGTALPLFARARGRDGAGPAGGRIPGLEGSRTPTGTAGARPPGQPAPASAAGLRHRRRKVATVGPREQVTSGLPPPPPGYSVASCRPGGACAGLGHNPENVWPGGGGG